MSQQSTGDDILFVIVVLVAIAAGVGIVIAWLAWSPQVFAVVTMSALCYWYFFGGKHNDPDDEESP